MALSTAWVLLAALAAWPARCRGPAAENLVWRTALAGARERKENPMKKSLLVFCSVAAAAPLAAAPAPKAEPAPAPITPLYTVNGHIPTEKPFVDVPKDHWAYNAVEYLRQLGIIEGYPPDRTHFLDDEAANR